MTHGERVGWGLAAVVVAIALLLLAREATAQDATFMPKGGRALLLELLGAPSQQAELAGVARSRRSEPEWKEYLAARKGLDERQRATLAAYLAGNMPLAEAPVPGAVAAALPADGRDLAWNECQSCHSLFSGYLTQSRDAQGWRNIFLSPFHRQMALTPAQREEFARYAALNMPMKADDVPQDLRY